MTVRRSTWALIPLVLTFAAAPAAHATTVTLKSSVEEVEGDGSSDPGDGFGRDQDVSVDVVAAAGERNAVTVRQDDHVIRVTDTGAPITAGAGCKAESATVVACVVPAEKSVDIARIFIATRLGDGDDTFAVGGRSDFSGKVEADVEVSAAGEDGNDTLGAGGGYAELGGGAGNDALTGPNSRGGDGEDLLTGTSGADLLFGEAGKDVVTGLAGNDSIYPGAGDDVVDGGTGVDEVGYGDAKKGVTIDLAAGTMTDGLSNDTLASVENAGGSDRADRISGDDGPNSLAGGKGADVIDGRGGNDNLEAENTTATLHGGAGDDHVGLLTRTSDCGAGRDSFYAPVVRLGVVQGSCEIADGYFPEQIAVEPGIDVAKSGLKNGRFVVVFIYTGKTRKIDVQLYKGGKVLAEKRRVTIRGSKAGRVNTFRVALRAQGRKVLRKGKLTEVQLWLKADTENVPDTQHVTLKR